MLHLQQQPDLLRQAPQSCQDEQAPVLFPWPQLQWIQQWDA
ncbi:hypothetical protein EVA_04193 [gut metagenome]|uniref:Uncharacterized protein n=1 Tax=gut metagenome TaxID=749906 RepID=J9H2E9_9ZZZZ